jgi:hypothetical protein
LNVCASVNAPLWCRSSPSHQSIIGADGYAATCAGCASIMPAATKKPGAEFPHVPTRPLLCATCFTSQSIVSYVSVDSSTLAGPRGPSTSLGTCGVMNW